MAWEVVAISQFNPAFDQKDDRGNAKGGDAQADEYVAPVGVLQQIFDRRGRGHRAEAANSEKAAVDQRPSRRWEPKVDRLERRHQAAGDAEADQAAARGQDFPGFTMARFRAIEVQVLAMEFTELRILGSLAAGQNVGPESSMLKTRGTELQQAVTELATAVCGHYGFPRDTSTPAPGDNFQPVGPEYANGATQRYLNTRKVSIFAGSNEIQRNIMSKMVLGL